MSHLTLGSAIARYAARNGGVNVSYETVARVLRAIRRRRGSRELTFAGARELALADCRVNDPDTCSELRSIIGIYCGSLSHPIADQHREVMLFIAYEVRLEGLVARAQQANEHLVSVDETWVGNQFIVDPDHYHPDCGFEFVPDPKHRWRYPMGRPRRKRVRRPDPRQSLLPL